MPIKLINVTPAEEHDEMGVELLPPTSEIVDKINEMASTFNKFEKKDTPKLDPKDRKLLNEAIKAMNMFGEKLTALTQRLSELEDTVYGMEKEEDEDE